MEMFGEYVWDFVVINVFVYYVAGPLAPCHVMPYRGTYLSFSNPFVNLPTPRL